MGRPLRFVIPGNPQYIVQRGNNKTKIFLSEIDYHYFHERLRFISKKYSCDIHAYVLMPDHFQLLVTGYDETAVSKMMQILSRYYVQYFNQKYGRTGTLWEGRYKAALIESKNYLFTCSCYIESIPVCAGIVDKLEDYFWSSYRSNAFGVNDYLTSPHLLFRYLGENGDQRGKSYQKLFEDNVDQNIINNIRYAVETGWVIGSDEFKQEVQLKLNRSASPAKRGGDRRSLKYQQSKQKILDCSDR